MGYLDFIHNTLKSSAGIALQYFGKVTPKTKPGDNNQILTEADIKIGEYIVNEIQKDYPKHNIIDEEAGVINNGVEFTWVIDPIEGTSNFASGSEDYGIMIGLLKDDLPIAGGVIAPSKGLIYLAEKGKGATKNGKPINVTKEANLLNVLVSFGIDAYQEDPDRTDRESKLLRDVILGIRNLRNTGCEAIDSMNVAEGIYGGRINLTSKIWDNVGPQIIIEEAGGVWTDVFGSKIDYTNHLNKTDQNFTNCISSPVLHSQLIELTRKHRDIK